jgi:hypothetical protein
MNDHVTHHINSTYMSQRNIPAGTDITRLILASSIFNSIVIHAHVF